MLMFKEGKGMVRLCNAFVAIFSTDTLEVVNFKKLLLKWSRTVSSANSVRSRSVNLPAQNYLTEEVNGIPSDGFDFDRDQLNITSEDELQAFLNDNASDEDDFHLRSPSFNYYSF